MKTLHDVIAAWRGAKDGPDKREVCKDFKKFVAEEATHGDLYELMRAMSNKGYVSFGTNELPAMMRNQAD